MQNIAEQVKNSLKTSAIVGSKVQLKAKGNGEFTGLCPFHSEKTPSFTVNDEKQFYHCFGCAEHGDVFTFIMKTEGLPYKESLEKLAGIAGIQMPKFDKQYSQKQKRLQRFYEIYKISSEYFHKQLFGSQGAISYFKSRDITSQIAQKFNLGYCPPNTDELYSLLIGKGYTQEEIVQSKVIAQNNNNNSFYSLFSNRVIFTISNSSGHPIAFGGRIIADDAGPKYINSPENPVFHKGAELYNLNHAKSSAYKNNAIIVAEGYMDVIAMHQNGFENVVAPLGTAIKAEQITKLWHYVDNIILCMDCDQAGIKAMHRTASLALPMITEKKTISFAKVTGAKDPDEFLKKHGADKFAKLLESSTPLADFIFQYEVDNNSLQSPEQKTSLQKKLDGYASNIKDDMLQKNYKYHFKSLIFNHFRSRNKKGAANSNTKTKESLHSINSHDNIVDFQIVGTIINGLEVFSSDHKTFSDLHNVKLTFVELDRLLHNIIECYECGELAVGSRVEEFKEKFLKSFTSICQKNKLLTTNFLPKTSDLSEHYDLLHRLLGLKNYESLQQEIEGALAQACKSGCENDFARLSELKRYEDDLKYKLGINH